MVRSVECTGIRIRRVLFFGGAASPKDALSDERMTVLLMPAGMSFVVVGAWMPRWTYRGVV